MRASSTPAAVVQLRHRFPRLLWYWKRIAVVRHHTVLPNCLRVFFCVCEFTRLIEVLLSDAYRNDYIHRLLC